MLTNEGVLVMSSSLLQRAPVRGRWPVIQRSSSGRCFPHPHQMEERLGICPLGPGPMLHLGGFSPPKIKFLQHLFSFQPPQSLNPEKAPATGDVPRAQGHRALHTTGQTHTLPRGSYQVAPCTIRTPDCSPLGYLTWHVGREALGR
jgi:hypothetical protein